MLWLPLILVSCTLWGIGNVGDKYLLSHHFKSPYVYATLPFLLGIFGVAAAWFSDFHFLNISGMSWTALAAFLFFVATFLFYKALAREEVSRVAILLNLVSPLTLVLAWQFIGEQLSARQLIVFGLMFAGSFMASIKISHQKIKLSIAWLYIFFACLFYAAHDVIVRYLTATRSESPFTVFIYLSFFLAFFSLFCFGSRRFRGEWRENTKMITSSTLLLLALIVVCYRVAVYLYIKATVFGPVALINAFQGFQTIVAFGLVALVNVFNIVIIKEELDRNNLIVKILGLIFMVGGVALLYLK